MPTLPRTSDGSPQPWVSQTPQTAADALSQSTLIKDQIINHQRSSLIPILTSIDQLAKATVTISYRMTLLISEVRALQEANIALSKRRRAKRTRLQDSGPLTGKEAEQLLAEKGIVEQESCDESAREGSSKRRKTSVQHCNICHKAGHNARTCSEVIEIDYSSDSNFF